MNRLSASVPRFCRGCESPPIAQRLRFDARPTIHWARRWCHRKEPARLTTATGDMHPQSEEERVAEAAKTIVGIACPSPLPAKDTILLGHGSGGTLTADLIRDIFLPAFQNPVLDRLDDQAIVNVNG